MRITTPLLLLFACLNSVSGYGLNFVRFVTNFFIHPALLDDWEYAPAVGAVLLLAAIAVAQYGFLPIRPARLVAKLESRYLGQKERRHGGRRPRHAGDTETWEVAPETRPELLEAVLKAALVLGEALQRYGPAPSAT
ncbi:uncharacterized protein LOC122369087 isoform X1 [Amphibalanus amphitrite]|uniref:uncharacterized protein LOC122369087 isoform X1 n=1 Tax=Amphibalanus amphitrite TaxID=1232801 RepID=UPI001C908A36|nr:uncharacterized protein LOC122369087 isoform X1 [Amphibalanus amphitrite]